MQRDHAGRATTCTDAEDFYEGNDRGRSPRTRRPRPASQPPYRLSVRDAQRVGDPVFSLTSSTCRTKRAEPGVVHVRRRRRGQAEDYGKFRILRLPGQHAGARARARSPTSSAPTRRSRTSWLALTRNANVRVLYGNLLTLPVGGGLLYVQPLYAVRSGTGTANYPVLQFVLVSFGRGAASARRWPGRWPTCSGSTNFEETPSQPENPTPPSGQPENGGQPATVVRPAPARRRPVQGGRPGACRRRPRGVRRRRRSVPSGSSSGRWPRPSCRTRAATEATDPDLSGTRFGASPARPVMFCSPTRGGAAR